MLACFSFIFFNPDKSYIFHFSEIFISFLHENICYYQYISNERKIVLIK